MSNKGSLKTDFLFSGCLLFTGRVGCVALPRTPFSIPYLPRACLRHTPYTGYACLGHRTRGQQVPTLRLLDITCPSPSAPPTQLDVTLSGQAYSKTGHFQLFFMNVFYGWIMKQMLANIKDYQKFNPPKPKPTNSKKFNDPLAGL